MPHISVTMYPGRTAEQKQKLAEELKTTVVKELGCPEGVVSVSVEEIEPDKWQDHVSSFDDSVMYVKPKK